MKPQAYEDIWQTYVRSTKLDKENLSPEVLAFLRKTFMSGVVVGALVSQKIIGWIAKEAEEEVRNSVVNNYDFKDMPF